MKFEILKESESGKAVFIRVPEEDKELWMPKSLIKKDGNLSKKAEFLVDLEPTNSEKAKIKEKKEKGYKVDLSKKSWESEKCYGFDIQMEFYSTIRSEFSIKRVRIFVSKSVLEKHNGRVPAFIVDNAIQDKIDEQKQWQNWFEESNKDEIFII